MFAEELKQKPVSPLRGALITLGCVFALLLSSFVVSFVQYAYRIVWPQFLFYAGIVAAIVFAVRRYFTEYIYLIEKDRITFGRRIGKREKELLFVPLRDVIWIGPYKGNERKKEGKKVHKFTYLKEDTWSLIDCGKQVIILSCTPQYTERLRERIKKRTEN